MPISSPQEPSAAHPSGVTLLDRAEGWIAALCAAHPPLRDCVEDIEELAREQFHVWDSRHEAVLALLQEHDHDGAGEGQRGFGGRHGHFVATRVLRAIRVGHESLSVFLGAADDPLPRQHRALVIVSMALAILCVGPCRPLPPVAASLTSNTACFHSPCCCPAAFILLCRPMLLSLELSR